MSVFTTIRNTHLRNSFWTFESVTFGILTLYSRGYALLPPAPQKQRGYEATRQGPLPTPGVLPGGAGPPGGLLGTALGLF